MSQPDVTNLKNCVEDVRQAALDMDPGPADPVDFNNLRGRLQSSRPKMPPIYIDDFFTPYVETLEQLGESDFNRILLDDPGRENAGGLLLDMAHSILQRGESFEAKARASFQEVVSDLYDGFLSAEDRRGIQPPEHETIAPLVKFGRPEFGPYTWPVDATGNTGARVAVVSLPPSNGRTGLLAWPALGHETGGHDILHADEGLLLEVSNAVRAALTADNAAMALADYWADRIDETASDVLGILNMGPAPGIGLLGFFRGLNAAFGGNAKLRNTGPVNDPHPADIVRGFLAAATVRQLEFAGAADWAAIIEAETKKDVTTIMLAGMPVSQATAKRSAEIVSEVIVTNPMMSLEGHAFGQIQNWRDEDEETAERLKAILTTANALPSDLTTGTFAAHVVAAATMAALVKDANIPIVFRRMLDLLKSMNEKNATFGPLGVRHPGDITRHRIYVPHANAEKVAGAWTSGKHAAV